MDIIFYFLAFCLIWEIKLCEGLTCQLHKIDGEPNIVKEVTCSGGQNRCITLKIILEMRSAMISTSYQDCIDDKVKYCTDEGRESLKSILKPGINKVGRAHANIAKGEDVHTQNMQLRKCSICSGNKCNSRDTNWPSDMVVHKPAYMQSDRGVPKRATSFLKFIAIFYFLPTFLRMF